MKKVKPKWIFGPNGSNPWWFSALIFKILKTKR